MRDGATADVVIVGGGIAGCAAAYYLADMGARPVVVERERVAGAASGFAQGGLYPMSGPGMDGPFFPFAMESLTLHHQLYPTLRAETGLDTRLTQKSILTAALDEGDVADLAALGEQVRGRGFAAEWVDAAGARALEPGIGPGVLGALLTHDGWLLDSETLTHALMAAAQARGAQLRIAGVRGLQWAGGRVAGVDLDDGTAIATERVVLAMGPWSASLHDWLGVRVPVRPLKGEILRLRSDARPVQPHVAWQHSYLVHKADGLLWAGTTEDDAGFDREPTAWAAERIMAGAARVFPAIAGAVVSMHTACLRPVTPDSAPIIGVVPGAPGVVIATGGGRKGILAGPALGLAAAHLATTGQTPLPIAELGLERFQGV